MNKYIISTIAGAALLLNGCQVISGERTVNQYSNDAAITANVKAKLLSDPKVTSLPIHVATDKGTVILSGFVKTREQKLAAGRDAALIEGAKFIRNDLIIRR
jgi:osmotically-inducible protein OsmY